MSARKIKENLDQDSTFFEEIETNGNICSNCYRRVRYRYENPEQIPNFVSDRMEYQDDVEFAYFDDFMESGRPSIKRAYCPCGSVDRKTKMRPLDKDKVIEIAQRICNRLKEEGVDFDQDDFFDTVREKKSEPDWQFNEEKIFEISVEKSEIVETKEITKAPQ